MPSKANLAIANPNPNWYSKWIPGVMLEWWFTAKRVILISLSQTESTLGAGVYHAELDIILKEILQLFWDLRTH